MAGKIINNVPDFDPTAPGRQGSGVLRSWKLWALVAFIAGFFVGLLVLQNLFSGWTMHRAKAAPQVETSTQTPPAYHIEQAKVVLANVPVQPPADVIVPPSTPEAPQPPDPAPQQPQMRPMQPQARSQPKKLPTSMTWTINAELPQQEGFIDGRVPMRAIGCTLKPGVNLIPVVLEGVVESEIPGQIIGKTSAPVFDADGQDNLLIPQGTTVVGNYKSDLTLGSRRLGAGAAGLTMPGGRQLNLHDSYIMDASGSMGMGGTVTTAWGQVLAVATVFGLLDAAQRQAVPDGTWSGDATASMATQGSRTAQQIIQQMLEQAVKIKIPSGTQMNISVNQTIRVC